MKRFLFLALLLSTGTSFTMLSGKMTYDSCTGNCNRCHRCREDRRLAVIALENEKLAELAAAAKRVSETKKDAAKFIVDVANSITSDQEKATLDRLAAESHERHKYPVLMFDN